METGATGGHWSPAGTCEAAATLTVALSIHIICQGPLRRQACRGRAFREERGMDGVVFDGLILIVVVGLSMAVGSAIACAVAWAAGTPNQTGSERGRLMSNEERDDMVEEESSENSGALGAGEYEVEPEEDIEEPIGSRRSGSGGKSSAAIWVIIILVIVALIAIGVSQWQQQLQRQAEQERQAREQTRQTWLLRIGEDVPEAEKALAAGDIGKALEILHDMEESLELVAMTANQEGDTEAANRVSAMRSKVRDMIREVEPKYEELHQQMAELEKQAATQMSEVRRAMGQYVAGTAPADDAGQPAEAEGSEDAPEPAAGEEAPKGEGAAEAGPVGESRPVPELGGDEPPLPVEPPFEVGDPEALPEPPPPAEQPVPAEPAEPAA